MFLDNRLCLDTEALQAIVQLALDTAAIKQVADASKAAAAAAASFINSEDTDNESESDSSENDTDTDDSETTGITKKKNKSSNSSKKKSKLAPIAVVQNSRNELLPALTTFNVDLKRLGLSPYDIIRLPAILTKLRYAFVYSITTHAYLHPIIQRHIQHVLNL
jgi:hypothetical protein